MSPIVVLVGPPGAGKTTVAQVLAKRFGVDVRDTDHDVEVAEAMTVQDIFIDRGEEAFRALESAAVARALQEHDGVLSLGGGAVLSADTRSALRGHRVAHLDVGLAQAARRVGMNSGRPLLLGNVRGRLKALMDERRPLYHEVATFTVITDELSADQVADLVVEKLKAIA